MNPGGDIGAYVHMMHTPFYFASKAGLMSMVTSLGLLRRLVGVRNAGICLGFARVSGVGFVGVSWCFDVF